MSATDQPHPSLPPVMQTPVARASSVPPDPRPLDIESSELRDLARKLVVVATLRVLLVTVSLGASVLFSAQPVPLGAEAWQYTLIAIVYGLSVIYAFALRYQVAILALGYAQVFIDSLLVTTLVVRTGGLESVFTFVYIFVVLGAAITLYRRGAITAVLWSLLLFGTVALVQIQPGPTLLPQVDASRAALSFLMSAIGLGLVGALGSGLTETARSTGRRLAERESDLQRLEALHAAILRSLPAGLMTVDPTGTIHYANEAALSILRVRPWSLIDRPLVSVVRAIADRLDSLGADPLPNARERYEGDYLRPDGTTIRLGFSFAPLSLEHSAGIIVVFQDVTNIVMLKEAVERAERLASVGKIAAGLAHEVRNPLASMCASIDVLKDAVDPPESMRRLMDNIVREGDRLNRLISDFLDFARPRRFEAHPTDISALVASFAEMFEQEAKLQGCTVATSLEPEIIVGADADMLRQVLWNLCRNALQAMRTTKDAHLTLAVRSFPDYAEIIVRDTGTGIPAEALKRIFDPFFTTKDRGTGLGLAIAHSIVEAHDGKMLVSSNLGSGAEFTVRLPRGPRRPSISLPDGASAARYEIIG